MSIIRIGMSESKSYGDGYDAIFGTTKKAPAKKKPATAAKKAPAKKSVKKKK